MEEIGEGTQQTLFKIVKQMAQSAMDVMGPTCVKDEDGNIVTEDDPMREVWRRYMEHLMNVENPWDGHIECKVKEGPRCLISQAEVTSALLHSNRGKSTGPSGVATELILASGKLGIEWMTDLCNDILDEGLIPSD